MNLMINYSSKWWYKLITILLILALILYFSIGIVPKAHAVVVSTVIVGTVLAALAATGIGLSVSGLTSQELTQWVSDKLGDWTADIGGSIQDHINNNLITVTANGILSIGSAAANGIADFISWLKTEDNLTDNTTSVAVQNAEAIVLQVGLYNKICHIGNYLSARYEGQGNVYVVVAYDTNNNRLGPLYISDFRFNNNLRYISNPGSYIAENTAYENGVTINNINYDDTTNLYYIMPWYFYGGVENVSQSYAPVYDSKTMALSSVRTIIDTGTNGGSITYNTGVITIPTIDETERWYIDVGADAGEDVDTVTDGIINDTVTNTLDVTDEVAEPAQEVVIVNEDAIAVNVDHHMIGFTNLPDFAHLNLNSIWHYVSDAVDYASSWLSWFVSFLTAMPLLAIPLYMSFTLLVVLSFLRRFI